MNQSPSCVCPHVATRDGLTRSGWSRDCPLHRSDNTPLSFTTKVGVATWAAPTLEQQIVRWRAIEKAAQAFVKLPYNCNAEEWAIANDALRASLAKGE